MKSRTMSEDRSQILDGIRRSLRRGDLTAEARREVEQRLAAPPRGPAVARAQLDQPAKVALFCQWAEANNASVVRVKSADVPGEVASYLARNNLPLAGGWTRFRDFPAPQRGGTFHAQWARHGGTRTRP